MSRRLCARAVVRQSPPVFDRPSVRTIQSPHHPEPGRTLMSIRR
ncbi:hypothetical protein [Azospirillum doebereinerae]